MRTRDQFAGGGCDHVIARFREASIGCRPYFTLIHLQQSCRSRFGFKEGDFPLTELPDRTSIAVPLQNNLTMDEVWITWRGCWTGHCATLPLASPPSRVAT